MSKYLKLFSTDNDRVTYEGSNDYIEPYVSYVEGDNTVHYNKVEARLVVYYDIQDISAPTTIFTNYDRCVKSIHIDDKETISEFSQGNVTYLFDAVGQHIIKFEFNDQTIVGNNSPLLYKLTTVKRVVIPNTFTAIGPNAFNGCSDLTSITIPDSVTSIGESAFGGCTSLTSITIPSSVTSIGRSAFFSCSSLTSITVNRNNTTYDSRDNCNAIIETATNKLIQGCLVTVIPSSVTSIGEAAFGGCSSLTSITIPNSVTSIGDRTFAYCSSLTSITIPSSVTSIGNYAFAYCSSLTSITIPSSVTSIGNYAFVDCTGLTSIVSLATTAPTIQNITFQSVKNNGTLTVPSGSSGYDVWMGTGNYYLGKYGWTKVEQ